MSKPKETLNVTYTGSVLDDNTLLVTSAEDKSKFDFRKIENEILQSAMEMYNSSPKYRQYSVIPNETLTKSVLTLDIITTLATTIHSSLASVLTANNFILQAVTFDAYMGRAYECIFSNINTCYKLTYPQNMEDDDNEVFNEVKAEIENFNKFIDINSFIRDAVAGVFLEGNYSTDLRLEKVGDKVTSAVIDHYPLEICYPSDYSIDDDPILEVDMQKLRAALNKTYKKTAKGKKALYFEDIAAEIKNNYPDEIYKAYVDKENYVRLNEHYTGFMRVNHMGRKFGVSPFFKALRALVVLNNIEAADVADSKARSKKIIFQKLRKELLGANGERKAFAEMAYAHEQAFAALNTNFCLYTAPAFVEDLSYVIDDSKNDKTSNAIKTYTSKLLTALGISFADSELSSYSTANISVEQLMRTINSIAEQLERILNKYYQIYLEAIGYDKNLAPSVTIIDSEMLSEKFRKEFATFAYSTLGASRDTVFKLIGLDLDDETKKRQSENEKHLNDVFTPHPTSFNSSVNTTSSDNSVDANGEEILNGRPPAEDGSSKQEFDQQYSEEVRQ